MQHYNVLDAILDTIMANGGFQNRAQFKTAENALKGLGEELNMRSQAIQQLGEENKALKAELERLQGEPEKPQRRGPHKSK